VSYFAAKSIHVCPPKILSHKSYCITDGRLQAEMEESERLAAESKQMSWTEMFRGANGVSVYVYCILQLVGNMTDFQTHAMHTSDDSW
jgi:hypothetical protein